MSDIKQPPSYKRGNLYLGHGNVVQGEYIMETSSSNAYGQSITGFMIEDLIKLRDTINEIIQYELDINAEKAKKLEEEAYSFRKMIRDKE